MFNVARLSKIRIISRAKSEKCRSVSFLVLSHITPPHIRRIAATNQLLSKIRSSTVTLPLISDIESHLEVRLTSHYASHYGSRNYNKKCHHDRNRLKSG